VIKFAIVAKYMINREVFNLKINYVMPAAIIV